MFEGRRDGGKADDCTNQIAADIRLDPLFRLVVPLQNDHDDHHNYPPQYRCNKTKRRNIQSEGFHCDLYFGGHCDQLEQRRLAADQNGDAVRGIRTTFNTSQGEGETATVMRFLQEEEVSTLHALIRYSSC